MKLRREKPIQSIYLLLARELELIDRQMYTIAPSDPRRNYVIKPFQYRAIGVRGYWIVNFLTHTVNVFEIFFSTVKFIQTTTLVFVSSSVAKSLPGRVLKDMIVQVLWRHISRWLACKDISNGFGRQRQSGISDAYTVSSCILTSGFLCNPFSQFLLKFFFVRQI